jgi:putative adenylate-forming enzyme
MSKTMRKLGDLGAAMRNRRRLISVGTTREELLLLQRRRLVETARHAAAASPLYGELYAGTELAEDLDLRALPVVTKTMLMERFSEWVTDPRLRLSKIEAHLERLRGDDLHLDEYRCMTTAGTTGRRGIFVYDRKEWRECLVAFLRWSELTGLRPRLGRRVRVASVGAVSPLHMTARFGLSVDLALYALCPLDARAPLQQLVAALNDHRPEHLIGYPSMLSLLAIEQIEGRLRIAPRVVCTTGEVRTEEMSSNIRAAWETEPFDIYGTTEGLYAGDCEHHLGMHVFEDLGLVEVVDDRGDPVPDGVVGAKLLVTSFIKRAQPLLRYELSDLVALTSAPCPCGRSLARMVSVEGRSDDILELEGAGGRMVAVHPLTLRSPMAAFPELREYQVVHDDEGLHIRVVMSDGVAPAQAAERIAATLRAKLRTLDVVDDRLDVTVVAALPRAQGPSAKFKLIESRVSSATATQAPAQ